MLFGEWKVKAAEGQTYVLGNMCHWRLQSAEVENLKWKQNAKIEEFRSL